jgi:hypothetical protein
MIIPPQRPHLSADSLRCSVPSSMISNPCMYGDCLLRTRPRGATRKANGNEAVAGTACPLRSVAKVRRRGPIADTQRGLASSEPDNSPRGYRFRFSGRHKAGIRSRHERPRSHQERLRERPCEAPATCINARCQTRRGTSRMDVQAKDANIVSLPDRPGPGAKPSRNGGKRSDPAAHLRALDSRILAELTRRVELWLSLDGESVQTDPSVANPLLSPQTVRELMTVIDSLTRRESARRHQQWRPSQHI